MNRESTLSISIKEFLDINELCDFTGRLYASTKQTDAWKVEFDILKSSLKGYNGLIIFEYGIPGLPKVIDAVLLINQIIFVVEFKVGAKKYDTSDLAQVMGYALRLKYFQSESNIRKIVPILIATEANETASLTNLKKLDTENVYHPICCNSLGLRAVIDHFINKEISSSKDTSWQQQWGKAVYNPSPSIIEAVINAWNKQNVPGLTAEYIDEASKTNHLKAETEILNIIKHSKEEKRKSIIFLTGVPGAGKTLVGLNVSIMAQEDGASLLSGNGPLVEVLTEALTRNLKKHVSADIKNKLAVESIIRQVYIYKNEIINRMDYSTGFYTLKPEAIPSRQHVIIYDEAQRAWSCEKMISHTSRSGKKEWQNQNWKLSEPEILMWDLAQLSWGVLICLIGGGQEINRGEAGINEWLRALKDNRLFNEWDIYMAPELSAPEYNSLKVDGLSVSEICNKMKHYGREIIFKQDLHLKDCQRSTRAKGLSNFINLLIEGKATDKDYAEIRPFYRIYLTRNIDKAKQHLIRRKEELLPRGKIDNKQVTEIRTGVLMSSKAKRMRPLGYEIKKESEFRSKTPDWFLDLKDESIDSSDRLEVALTEFLVQGLEIDLGLVLWDADLRYENQAWHFYNCGKNKWTQVKDPTRQFYMRNAYRVLLTRSRSEMIIFIPEGSTDDPTRNPDLYKSTYKYLSDLNLEPL